MADNETPFAETQVGADGRRYKADDIEKVNEAIAKGETPTALKYEPTGAVQEGSGVATGVQGDQLSGDRSTALATGATEAKADEPGEAKHGRTAESSKDAKAADK